MKILMLGNSFTFYNDMPEMIAHLTGAEVTEHTRGGARLAEQLNPDTGLGAKTQAALRDEKWDYVVLQEMSNGPITANGRYMDSVSRLCAQIRENGAVPVIFGTWAYERGSQKMRSMNMTYEEMASGMSAACRRAAEESGAIFADVGRAFYEKADEECLYSGDGMHPSEAGSMLAAQVLAGAIERGKKECAEQT